MTMITTRFGIIRHAPTLWNEAKRIQGQEDSPLSARGLSLADTWGMELRGFDWDLLLCSDQGRVLQTVEQLNRSLRLPVSRDQRLREQHWGAWTGMTLKNIKELDLARLRDQENMGWDFRPPGGESRNEVLERSMTALAEAHGTNPGRNILVVCHEGVIKCLLYSLLGRGFMPDEPQVIHGFYLHLLVMKDGKLTLEKMNALELTDISGTGPG